MLIRIKKFENNTNNTIDVSVNDREQLFLLEIVEFLEPKIRAKLSSDPAVAKGFAVIFKILQII